MTRELIDEVESAREPVAGKLKGKTSWFVLRSSEFNTIQTAAGFGAALSRSSSPTLRYLLAQPTPLSPSGTGYFQEH